jgi:hypothetical protein
VAKPLQDALDSVGVGTQKRHGLFTLAPRSFHAEEAPRDSPPAPGRPPSVPPCDHHDPHRRGCLSPSTHSGRFFSGGGGEVVAPPPERDGSGGDSVCVGPSCSRRRLRSPRGADGPDRCRACVSPACSRGRPYPDAPDGTTPGPSRLHARCFRSPYRFADGAVRLTTSAEGDWPNSRPVWRLAYVWCRRGEPGNLTGPGLGCRWLGSSPRRPRLGGGSTPSVPTVPTNGNWDGPPLTNRRGHGACRQDRLCLHAPSL